MRARPARPKRPKGPQCQANELAGLKQAKWPIGQPIHPMKRGYADGASRVLRPGRAPFAGSGRPDKDRHLRKEVIQPQVPLRLPCYDFTPVADPTVDGCLLLRG